MPLDPFAPVLSASFDLAAGTAPARLLAVPLLPTVAGLDTGTGTLLVMDARYRHGGAARCVPLFDTPLPDDDVERRGRCDAESFEVQRGSLAASVPYLAAATDPARGRLLALDARGWWWTANVDLDVGDAADWVRPLQAGVDPVFGEVAAEGGVEGSGLLAVSNDGAIAAVFGATVWTWEGLDAPGAGTPLPAAAQDLAWLGETLVLATAEGVQLAPDAPAVDVGGAAARVAVHGATVWVTVPDVGSLVALDATGAIEAEVAVSGLTGPLSVDPQGRVWVAVDDGVAVIADGAEVARHAGDAPLDLVAQPSGEVALLRADGRVDVHFDETAIPDGAPLGVAVAAFFENPRKQTDDLICRGEAPNLRDYLDSVSANRDWLDDVPATVLLGVTPGVARRAIRCVLEEELLALTTGDRIETGVLFHEAPDCEADDQDCVDAHVAREFAALQGVPLAPTWTSGASAWDLDGTDWIAAVNASGAPGKHLFYGQAASPDVSNLDLRAKEPLPWAGTAPPTATFAVSSDSEMPAYPGMPISAFLLGSCENLLSVECGRVDAGGSATFDDADFEVLSLLLRRALYLRSADGPDTWYFHLPALELYDYSAGCSRSDVGIWSGEACQAALLQGWLFDVHARFVAADVAEWTLPSALAAP